MLGLFVHQPPCTILPPFHLYNTPQPRHDPVLSALLLLGLKFLYARPPLLLGNVDAADHHALLLAHAAVDIDVFNLDVQRAVARVEVPAITLPAGVEENQQRSGEVSHKPALGVEIGSADRVEGGVERGEKRDNVNGQADPRSPNAQGGAEGQLLEGVAVMFPAERSQRRSTCVSAASEAGSVKVSSLPGHSETNVSHGDGAEDKENCNARQREQPVKDGSAAACKVDICQQAEEQL